MSHTVTIQDVQQLAPDVKQFRTEKPVNFQIVPGQATYLSVDKPDLRNEKRPFSFTSLDPEHYLEFIVRIHPEHDEVTKELDKLNASDRLIMQDTWQAIQYKGPGLFLAYGIGITAFIAMFRRLREDDELEGHHLVYAGSTGKDLVLTEELAAMFGPDYAEVLAGSENDDTASGPIDKNFIEEHMGDVSGEFYICGPPEFVDNVQGHVKELGAEPVTLVYENVQMTST